MKKRLSCTAKWDDDWFLDLSPKMKCVWEYLRDNCDGGTGALKISFKKMSQLIGEEITRQEFDRHFSERVVWVGDDVIWLHGFLKAQFKSFCATNKAHVAMAKKVINLVGSAFLYEKAAKAFDELFLIVSEAEKINQLSITPPGTLPGGSLEGPGTLIGYREKGIGNRKEEIGVQGKEKKTRPNAEYINSADDLEASIPILQAQAISRRFPNPTWVKKEIANCYALHTSDPAKAPQNAGQWHRKLQSWLISRWDDKKDKTSSLNWTYIIEGEEK